MIIREVSILHRLTNMQDNEFSIKLYGTRLFKDDNNKIELFLILEHMPSDLKSILADPASYSYETIRIIMFNTLKAITYIHKANVIHRDLKPANILVNEDC